MRPWDWVDDVWLEELAPPAYHFREAGWEITRASPKTDQVALRTEQTRRFETDTEVTVALTNTVRAP
ncbi:hypothetical protein [Streptomyces sp. NPDC005423]|uniref:hypothetical protein n=1 Tax=Streptomyces sp. NPDC005423 TaxID=3155343 RepID=UPI0033A79DBB